LKTSPFRRRVLGVFALALATAAFLPTLAFAQGKSGKFITMASTTSTEQSGLFGHLLPAFKAATGVDVRVVAVGTGQALDTGRRGDADIVFVHDTPAEAKFVAEGFSPQRRDVMYNDFVLVGPKADPAGVKGNHISAALKKLAGTGQPFISRGDKSGTHAAELRLWQVAGVDVAKAKPAGESGGTGRPAGYKDCGCGMGPALNMGSSLNGYVLTDRGTWLNFKNRGDLVVQVEGDKSLFNQYGVMVVSKAVFPHVKADLAQQFADWVVSPAGQQSIAAYKIGGEQLFFPNARN
jgi:tungstate transport system substrate-binding protein